MSRILCDDLACTAEERINTLRTFSMSGQLIRRTSQDKAVEASFVVHQTMSLFAEHADARIVLLFVVRCSGLAFWKSASFVALRQSGMASGSCSTLIMKMVIQPTTNVRTLGFCVPTVIRRRQRTAGQESLARRWRNR